MMKSTKLFIVVNVDWFFLSHRKDIALAAQQNGYEVTIITKNTGKKNEIESLGLGFINLPMNKSGKNIFQDFFTLFFLCRIYREYCPTIVHHVGLKTILWGTLAAKIIGVKSIVNAISGLGIFFSEDNRSLFFNGFIKVMKFAHNRRNLKVIFQNNEDKSIFIKNKIIREDQCVMIKGSGINLDEFCYVPEPENGKIKILFTARMIEEKGVWILVEAAQKLRERYEERIQFVLCGGIDHNPLAIKEKDLCAVCDEKYLIWLGHRSDIFELLSSCHVVAFPSYYREGLPKSLIEATAVGRPIITTNSVGCKETVVEGENGYLIPIKDSQALVDKLVLLIEDPSLRKKMGKESRKIAEKDFSIHEVVKSHLEVYQELIRNIK